MAEGQIVVRWREEFRPLLGQPLLEVRLTSRWAEQAPQLVGQSVTRFETRGKHMLLHFSGGLILHCHAMVFGHWQIGPRPLELRKPPVRIRVRLVTATHEAVFFSGPVVELLTPEQLGEHRSLSTLGPDILAPTLDSEKIWRRLQRYPRRQIAEALLDQTIVAGIGNIYKNEVLFVAGIDPRRTVETVTHEEVERLLAVARELMQKSVAEHGAIATVPEYLRETGERRFVYQRSSRPCLNCGQTIRMLPKSPGRRPTFYCPNCQR